MCNVRALEVGIIPNGQPVSLLHSFQYIVIGTLRTLYAILLYNTHSTLFTLPSAYYLSNGVLLQTLTHKMYIIWPHAVPAVHTNADSL